VRIIRVADQPAVPWKNGGGTTRELLSASSNPGGFDWRISVATIERDGPFSEFPGVDRTLVALAGRGRLSISGRVVELAPGSMVRFSGDEPVVATVREGPIRVLNVMSAASRWRHEIEAAKNIEATRPLDDRVRMFAVVQAGETSDLHPGDLLLDVDQPADLEGVIAVELSLFER
jgi:uncharacterized protein